MDILLTHGHFLSDDAKEREIMRPYPPLGILYLSAYLKQRDFDVEVFDSTFASKSEFQILLAAKRPGVVGIYANLMTKVDVLDMIRSAKKQGCTVVVGGPDPPYYAEEYLDFGVDVVVVGEGEQALAELIPALGTGRRERLAAIAGLVFRDGDGRVQRTPARPLLPDLDILPLPDRQAIDVHRYVQAWRQHHGMGAVSLITARGCPYTCTWCSHSVFGKSLRKRSPQKVADEVDALLATYHPDMLWYADDVFNIDHKWLFAYAAELEQRRIAVPFECICRADRLNEEIITTLKKMGCFRLWIGSESGSQRLLDAMKRGVKAEQVQAMTRLANKYGIETGMFLMWGFEDENRADIALTIAHVKKANPDHVLTTVSYPIKGTAYYQKMADLEAVVAPVSWERSSDRDFRICGRHTSRYYDFVNRWLFNEIAREKLRGDGSGYWLRRVRAFCNVQIGKLGMAFWASRKGA